jgi:hypothetical protein
MNQTHCDSHLLCGALGYDFWQYLPRWVELDKINSFDFNVVEEGLNADGMNKVLGAYRDGNNPGRWNVHPNA